MKNHNLIRIVEVSVYPNCKKSIQHGYGEFFIHDGIFCNNAGCKYDQLLSLSWLSSLFREGCEIRLRTKYKQ